MKKSGYALDPSDLNKVIKREHHPMRTGGLNDSRIKSVKSVFLQIELDEPSSFLTTFNTPLGRFRWLRLPFGIKCALEIFQHIMDQMLEGIRGSHKRDGRHPMRAPVDKEGIKRFLGFITYLSSTADCF